jgi:cell division protein ZapA
MSFKNIKVKIFGTEYSLKVEDEELAYRIAEYVDALMSELHEKFPNQPALTIAVLTALNIAEELFKERARGGYVMDEVERELRNLSERIDKILTL